MSQQVNMCKYKISKTELKSRTTWILAEGDQLKTDERHIVEANHMVVMRLKKTIHRFSCAVLFPNVIGTLLCV